MIAITGATNGLGFQMAKSYAKTGESILLIGRNEQKLADQKKYLQNRFKNRVEYIVSDLSSTSSTKNVFWEIRRNNYKINVFINNAGVGTYGELTKQAIDQEIKMLNTNIQGLTILTYDAIEYMTEKKIKGQIVNISSVASYSPTPLMAAYGASKAYVSNFSHAVSKELAEMGSSIIIQTVYPAATNTSFAKNANAEESAAFKEEVMDDAVEISEQIIKGIKNRNKSSIYVGTGNFKMRFFSRIMPLKVRLMYTYNMLRRK